MFGPQHFPMPPLFLLLLTIWTLFSIVSARQTNMSDQQCDREDEICNTSLHYIPAYKSANDVSFHKQSLPGTYRQPNQKDVSDEFVWIGKIFSDSMWSFAPRSDVNEKCTKQGEIYRQYLSNGTHWAVQMLDSSVMAPSGLVDGDIMQLGHADQCIYTQVPIHDYQTKFCLPTGVFQTKSEEFYGRNGHGDWPPYDTSKSIWDFLRDRHPFIRHNRKQFTWGLCVPKACSAQDLETSLQSTLSNAFDRHNITFQVQLSPVRCYSAKQFEQKQMPLAGELWLSIVQLLFILMVMGTVVDYQLKKKEDEISEKQHEKFKTESDAIGPIAHFLLNFSFIRNFEKLCKDPAEDEVSIVYGIKFLAMCFVILFHRFIESFGFAQNLAFFEHILHNPRYWMMTAATQLLDTFFFLCGFLLTRNFILLKQKHGNISPLLFILNRVLRIYPMLIASITFTIWVAPYVAEGPLWNLHSLNEAQKCEKYWWHNLLFISTLFENTDLCNLISWFISTDLQLFLISLLVIYVVEKYPSHRNIILTLAFVISHAAPSLFIYLQHESSLMMMSTVTVQDLNKDYHLRRMYVKFYIRGAPYISGLCGAYVINYLSKKQTVKFTGIQKMLLFAFAIFANIGLFYVGALFLEPGVLYNVWHHVIFAPVLRCTYGLGMFILLGVHILDGFGALSDFLSHPLLRVLGKLTFSMYLIHFYLISWDIFSSQASQYQNNFTVILRCCGDILLTTVVSLFTTLMYEMPIGILRNQVFMALAR